MKAILSGMQGMTRRVILPTVCVCAALLSPAAVAVAEDVPGVTVPSDDRVLSLIRPGLVAEVVKDGDVVTEGQVLLALDDSVEQASLAQLEAEANTMVHIQAAEANLAQKKVDYERNLYAHERGALSATELAHAELDVTIAELSLEKARFDHEQAVRKFEEAQQAMRQMRLLSPMDGVVDSARPKVGEAVDALKPVIRVVQISPLWIEVPVSTDQAVSLRLGQRARVYERRIVFNERSLESASAESRGAYLGEGEIIFRAPVADASSNKLRVRLSLANPDGLPPGQHVLVDFSAAAPPQALGQADPQ